MYPAMPFLLWFPVDGVQGGVCLIGGEGGCRGICVWGGVLPPLALSPGSMVQVGVGVSMRTGFNRVLERVSISEKVIIS